MNLTELAALAGVSVSTVSKAFSWKKEIPDKTRQHIFEVAKKAGCYDKYCKTSFDGKVIAVISPEYQSGLYSQFLEFLNKGIAKNNGIMIVSSSNFDKQKAEDLIGFFAENVKVSGIIALLDVNSDKKYNIPIVTLGGENNFDTVNIREGNAINKSVHHFKEKGHTDIAFIGELKTTGRLQVFKDAMKENELPFKDEYLILTDSRFEKSGYEAMNKLLELDNPPTAVFAAYDNIAFGAMKSIKEHNLKVPEDISIIGSDDNINSPYYDVPLTTTTAYNEDLCEIIIDLIFEKIEKGGDVKTINVSRDLVLRNSTAENKKSTQKN